ncbi:MULTISPECIES: DNA polymerase III subunit gamma/tau [Deefgea]|uniref:DNA polymerase III subunit gamma/tau n=1 Tax=Deefgea chitinilytica TaxID=570276 RepID=A0ABS2C7I4_9NEIS|nr:MULTISPECIES: DNA polymerase III subunit gamma/tau [Deefgea]MBM5570119.1 DNA polymerase III subunit gamma/tau [Deefgea chitinilytica]MBM9887348.1 DNA polymerase III subunit gamma/tau [Deefgea sp. CFH1-16]
MSYQVLARKWRPKTFAQLVGQEHVIKALANAFASERLHHAYLLTGTRGVGKTTIARIMAKALNCETGITSEPCGVCSACTQIDSGRFVDLLEIDAASNTGIDNIREVLDNAQYAPTAGRFKVYIIDEVHMLSKSAFNAMLKTLEEPPSHVKFILATTDPQKVPITVLSRCLQFSLRQMTPQQVTGHLNNVLQAEQIEYEALALNLIGHAASGSMRDGLSLLDQAIAYGAGKVEEAGVRAMLGAVDQSYLFELLTALIQKDGPALLKTADAIAERGLSYEAALHELASLLQQIALVQAVPNALADDLPLREQIIAIAQALTPEDTQLYYQIALHGRRDLPLAPDEYAGFTMTILRMLAFAPSDAGYVVPVNPSATAAPQQSVAASQVQTAVTPVAPLQAIPPVQATSGLQESVAKDDDTPPWRQDDVTVATRPAAPQTSPVQVPVTPAQADTPSVPASSAPAVFNGDWRALVVHLKLGQAGMLAQHAELLGYDDIQFRLKVEEEYRSVATRDYQEKLRLALSEHFGRNITLSVQIGEVQTETPADIHYREKQERQDQAVAAINADPFVQTLVKECGASIAIDSIKPI